MENQVPSNSLVAAAKRLTTKNITRGTAKATTKPWQEDAWEMYDLVGEQRFLATTLAGRLSQARLYVGEVAESDLEVPIETENTEVRGILDAVGGGPSGRKQLIARLAINLFVAGDGWLVGVPKYLMPFYERGKDEQPVSKGVGDELNIDDLSWHMLSVSEVRFSSGEEVLLIFGEAPEERVMVRPDNVWLVRVWRPHPRKAWEADSPTRSSLPVLRELVGLTMHISAQVDSRLAGAGLLVVPQSAQRALNIAAGLEEDDDSDPFTEALMEAMIEPINNRASASALVPLVVTVPDEVTGSFEFITFSKSLDTEARNLRDEAIRRLALGQDAPPELLLGTACVDTETEIMTQRGWQTLDTLDPSDIVLTLNPATGLSEWQPMEAVNRYEVADEPMLRMAGEGHDSLTTMNHRWLVTSANHDRTEFVTSADLNTGHRIPTAAPSGDLPTEAKFSDAFVEAVAWFWTEGHYGPRAGRWGQATISQSLSKNPERVARIRRCLIECFGSVNESEQTGEWGSTVVRFNLRKHEYEALAAVGGKHVTLDFVRSLTAAQLELFIDVSCQGDGWHYADGRLDIWQRDAEALDAYELALILSGRSVANTEYDGGRVVNPYVKGSVRPIKAGRATEETYSGTVWCPTTPNGTWLMRRNGQVAYTGNSMNHWGAWLVREDVVTTHIEPPLALICDALTTQYLWPVLEAQGMVEEEYSKYIVSYDVSKMVVRPNRAGDAASLHDKGVVSDATLRNATGFDDGDAPETPDEVSQAIFTMVQVNPELLTTPGVNVLRKQLTAIVEGSDIDPPEAVAAAPEQSAEETPAVAAESGQEPIKIKTKPKPSAPSDVGGPPVSATSGPPSPDAAPEPGDGA